MGDGQFALNEANRRFEMKVEGHIVFVEYILNKDNIMFLTHTEVPVAIEGKGIGSMIVLKALEYIKAHNYTLAPLCPFVAKYVRKHPEWMSILAEGYKV